MQEIRSSILALGVEVFNLYDGVHARLAEDARQKINLFSSQADAVVEVSGDDAESITASQATANWHAVTLVNNMVSIARPITAIRVTATTAVNVAILLE